MTPIDWTAQENHGYHRIEFPDGVVWPGDSDPRERLGFYRFPTDLSGKRVLDIGTWDGAFAFESVKRGASSVVAMDCRAWKSERAYDRFIAARARFGYEQRVWPAHVDVMELDNRFGTFDLVLFLQVLYHLHSPFQALLNVRKVCKDMMLLETMTVEVPESCAMFFGSKRVDLHGKATTYPLWWPSPSCVEDMLYDAGFARWERVWETGEEHHWSGTQKRRAWHVWVT